MDEFIDIPLDADEDIVPRHSLLPWLITFSDPQAEGEFVTDMFETQNTRLRAILCYAFLFLPFFFDEVVNNATTRQSVSTLLVNSEMWYLGYFLIASLFFVTLWRGRHIIFSRSLLERFTWQVWYEATFSVQYCVLLGLCGYAVYSLGTQHVRTDALPLPVLAMYFSAFSYSVQLQLLPQTMLGLVTLVSYVIWTFLISDDYISASLLCISCGCVIVNVCFGASMIQRATRVSFNRNYALQAQDKLLTRQTTVIDSLLRNMLPTSIVRGLREGTIQLDDCYQRFERCCVLFADIVGFTAWSSTLDPTKVGSVLHRLVCLLDERCYSLRCEKIKTVGDAYWAVTGVPDIVPERDMCASLCELGLSVFEITAQVNVEFRMTLEQRVGIHTGPITGGIIGKAKFSYDVWGETMDRCVELEEMGEAGSLHASRELKALVERFADLRSRYRFEPSNSPALDAFVLLRHVGPSSIHRNRVRQSSPGDVMSTLDDGHDMDNPYNTVTNWTSEMGPSFTPQNLLNYATENIPDDDEDDDGAPDHLLVTVASEALPLPPSSLGARSKQISELTSREVRILRIRKKFARTKRRKGLSSTHPTITRSQTLQSPGVVSPTQQGTNHRRTRRERQHARRAHKRTAFTSILGVGSVNTDGDMAEVDRVVSYIGAQPSAHAIHPLTGRFVLEEEEAFYAATRTVSSAETLGVLRMCCFQSLLFVLLWMYFEFGVATSLLSIPAYSLLTLHYALLLSYRPALANHEPRQRRNNEAYLGVNMVMSLAIYFYVSFVQILPAEDTFLYVHRAFYVIQVFPINRFLRMYRVEYLLLVLTLFAQGNLVGAVYRAVGTLTTAMYEDEAYVYVCGFAMYLRFVTDRVSFANLVRLKCNELQVEQQRKDAEVLLYNMLPRSVGRALKHNTQAFLLERKDMCTVIFLEVVGYSELVRAMEHEDELDTDVSALLNTLFSEFDELCVLLSVEKIKSVGPVYLAVAGAPDARIDHAVAGVELALRMHGVAEEVFGSRWSHVTVRSGVHSGALVSGVLGTRKFSYDVFGDTVNTASRLMSTSEPNTTQVSSATYHEIPSGTRGAYAWSSCTRSLKGKGDFPCYTVKRQEQ